MSIASTICSILYTVYCALKVTFETIIPFVFQLYKQCFGLMIKIFTMINEVWKDISNLAVTLLAQFQKMLVDLLMGLIGNPFQLLCSNMWHCAALLFELLDGNSLLTRALFKAAEFVTGQDEGEFECGRERYANAINYIKGVLNDFNEFQKIVCDFGFTVSFGVEELANKVKELQRQFSNFTNKINAALCKGIDLLEGLEKSIGATGIFDMLQKMFSFGNCILDDTSICNEFSTVNNFVTDVCSKFGIKHDVATGKFELDKDFLFDITNNFKHYDDFCNEMMGLIDGLVEPGGSIDSMFGGISYSKAYDLTNFIKGAYDYVTNDDFSISKTWDDVSSYVSKTWDKIMTNSDKLIIDNNLYAMGIYGYEDISIGDNEIRYYMPFYYIDDTEASKKLRYMIKDTTDIMKKYGYRTSYPESKDIDIDYPNDAIIKEIYDSIVGEYGVDNIYRGINDSYYTKLECFSEYVNLSNKIKCHKEDDKNYIKIRRCDGGIMLFMNCFSDKAYTDNITSDDVVNYEDKDSKESLGTEEIVLDSGADLDSMFKPTTIGDKITNVGTLALAMRDYMKGEKTELVDKFGEENLKKSIEYGKRVYAFININVKDLATRYA